MQHNRHADDHREAQYAEQIRNLPKREKSQRRRKEDAGVVIDDNLARFREPVRPRDAKLPERRPRARPNQHKQLQAVHRTEPADEERHARYAGEDREEKNDERAIHSLLAELVQERIGGACAETAIDT